MSVLPAELVARVGAWLDEDPDPGRVLSWWS